MFMCIKLPRAGPGSEVRIIKWPTVFKAAFRKCGSAVFSKRCCATPVLGRALQTPAMESAIVRSHASHCQESCQPWSGVMPAMVRSHASHGQESCQPWSGVMPVTVRSHASHGDSENPRGPNEESCDLMSALSSSDSKPAAPKESSPPSESKPAGPREPSDSAMTAKLEPHRLLVLG